MKKKTSILILVALVVCTSCDISDPIYDTPHPAQGQITFSTDWSGRTEGITIPATVTARVGTLTASLSTGTATVFPNLVQPGTYHVNVYNAATGISVDGTTATADYGAAGGTGWFFTWAGDQAIEPDRDYTLTAVMQQQVRQLTLVLQPTGSKAEQISTVAATLTGVASTLDVDAGTHAAPVSLSPVFTRQSDGTYTATLRLLGTAGSSQQLTVTVTFTGDHPLPITATHHLSSVLTGFNADKRTPLTLESQVIETPSEAGFTATITPWEKVSGSGTAK